ncbi:MAG: molybdenum cofactor guanylyltransferase [Gemmatimonadaceae bacterium]
MRPLPEGTTGRAVARAARGTRAHRRPRRRGAAARPARLIGAIVAGGGSVRFGGAPKGLLRVGDRRIIDTIASALQPVTSEIVVVSNAEDAEAWLPGARIVRDVRQEHGSLVGIHSALSAATDAALVVAWDMPFVNPGLFALIRDRLSDRDAAVPEGPHGLEGLCAAYSTRCLPAIEAALDAGDLRVSALVARLLSLRTIPAADLTAAGDPSRMFFNVNTAADLELAGRLATS